MRAELNCFKAYDIRGRIPDELNEDLAYRLGRAYAGFLRPRDQIKTFADTPLKLNKKLYKVVSTPKGDELTEITENTSLKPGDKLKIRIELRVDREIGNLCT